jgi:hypothetical protein
MKMPLNWHKQCLLNQKQHLNHTKEKLDRAQAEYDRCFASTMFYIDQVEQAEKEGREGFDSDKYLRKIKK